MLRKSIWGQLVCTSCIAIFALASVSQAVTTSHIPVSDRDAGSTSDAGPWTLRPDGLGALIVGSGFGGPEGNQWRASMEFNIAGVNQFVQSAYLTLFHESTANPPAAWRTHGFLGDGVVTVADIGVNNEIAPIQTTTQGFTIDVTDFVQAVVDQNETFAGITLSGFPGGSGFSFRSSEPFVGAPSLTITSVVPEPACIGLMGVTLLMLRRPQG